MQKAYPNQPIDQAAALAKKAIVSHIHRMGIKSVGRKHDLLAFQGSDFPCREMMILDIKKETVPKSIPPPHEQKRWLVGVLAGVIGLMIFFFYPKTDHLQTQLEMLREAGDIKGLQALNREYVSVRETIPDHVRNQLIDRVANDLGIEVEMNPVHIKFIHTRTGSLKLLPHFKTRCTQSKTTLWLSSLI